MTDCKERMKTHANQALVVGNLKPLITSVNLGEIDG